MSKRDLIAEIIAKKLRSKDKWSRASSSLYELERSFASQEKEGKGPFALYLIGVASCMEVAVREAVRRLVDHGSPYLDRIDEFKQHLRFDLDVVRALGDQHISFGDLVAHLLPVSSVEHIDSHLGALLGCKLRQSLADIREFVEPPASAWLGSEDSEDVPDSTERKNLVPNPDELLAVLSKIFTARHIAAHEADFSSVSRIDLVLFFQAARKFIDALEEIIDQTLHPNAPRSSFGLSLQVASEAGEIYSSMEETTQQVLRLLQSDAAKELPPAVKEFQAAQDAFHAYLEAETAFEEARVRPFSGNALRFLDSQIYSSLCGARNARLKEVVDDIEELISIRGGP